MRFGADRPQKDFDEEIESHLALEAERLKSDGWPEDEALWEARRRFGNRTTAQERYHERGRVAWLSALTHDLRFAWRQLRRSPGFASVVVVTLALGIGANAVMFRAVDRLLLSPPPGLTRPDELRRVYFNEAQGEGTSGVQPVTGYPFITALREGVPSLDVAAVGFANRRTLGRGANASEVVAQPVSANYFALLGATPQLGRFFAPGGDWPATPEPVAVISHGFWQRQFGGRPDAIGSRIQVDRFDLTVLGVASRDFTGVESGNVDVWVPMNTVAAAEMGEDWATNAGNWWLRAVVRLPAGVDTEGVEAQATTVFRNALRAWDQPWRDSTGSIVLGSIIEARHPTESPAEARVSLWLVGVSAIVLLVACANVANLLLARAVARRREIAVRLAIGIGRRRLVRQLVTETLLLALLAAAAALAMAKWGWDLLRAVLLPNLAPGTGTLDGRVLLVTGVATLLTVLLAGLTPALQASRADVARLLTGGGRDGGGRRARLRTALLITQAALSVMLLVGAGLFVMSLQRARAADVGVDVGRVVLTNMDLNASGYTQAERRAIYLEAVERARAVPGVTHASLVASSVPMRAAHSISGAMPGRDSLPRFQTGGPYHSSVDEHYLAVLGARMVRGRGIDAADVQRGARVVVVNETVADAWWPAGDAVGSCLILGSDSACSEVVGVVENVVLFQMFEDERALLYLPHGHPAVRSEEGFSPPPAALLVRTAGPAASVANVLRRELQSLRPGMGYVDASTFEELLAPQLRPWRLGATMFTVFGVLALLIAAVGTYGVLAYAVSQRIHEMGVRMALGAARSNVMRLIVSDGVRVTLAGIAIGAVLAWLAAPRIAELLHETSPREPVVFAIVAAVLLAVAILASLVPGWRASRVDPAVALKAE